MSDRAVITSLSHICSVSGSDVSGGVVAGKGKGKGGSKGGGKGKGGKPSASDEGGGNKRKQVAAPQHARTHRSTGQIYKTDREHP